MIQDKKIIFGFTGLIASGKGTAAKYIAEKYGASTYRFSTILRDLLNRIYLEQSRDNMIRMSESIRSVFGEDILAKVIAGDAKKDQNKIIVIEGIRRLSDIEYLAKLPNFVLVEIFAEPQLRHTRLTKRNENPDDTTKTYEQFLADHQRSTELSVLEVLKKTQEKINNNGDWPELQKQLDNLVEKYS